MAPSVKREDLIVPYIHTPLKAGSATSGVVSQSMPMAAMFMKNKLLSWFSLISSVQALLGEINGEPVAEGGQSAYLRIGLGIIGLVVCYMELFVPASVAGIPKKVAETVVETAAASTTS